MEKKTKVPLVKGSSTYKMIIPEKVEKQIRFLCERSWTTEWSGVLFYTYNGSFEDGSLVVTCVDIYPMDIGSAAYTEFNMSPDVIGYMAQNPELLDCKSGLIHSHNTMSTFFSGTDLATLEEEGNEKNHFVSLIVNNAGKYTAAITRKINYKQTRSFTYEGFEGPIKVKDPTTYEGTAIEYFNLDITIEGDIEDSIKTLAERFDEIKKKKTAADKKPIWSCNSNTYQPKTAASPKPYTPEYPSLFKDEDNFSYGGHFLDADTEREVEKCNKSFGVKEDKPKKVEESANKDVAKSIVAQLITGSVIINDYNKVKDPKWIDTMKAAFDRRFGKDSEGETLFKFWAEDFIQFLLWYSIDDNSLDPDTEAGFLAEAIVYELKQKSTNKYIEFYIKTLERYYV